jgi:hypothetical protein
MISEAGDRRRWQAAHQDNPPLIFHQGTSTQTTNTVERAKPHSGNIA